MRESRRVPPKTGAERIPDRRSEGVSRLSAIQAGDAAAFLSGAAKAYETVLQAYAGGNVDMLKRYVGPEVFGAFERAIVERQERNETLQLTFVGIGMHEATILDTMRTGDLDEVAVRFMADVVSVTRSADDGVIAGDAQNIVQVTDVWTFSRNILSNDPNWQLVATSGDQ